MCSYTPMVLLCTVGMAVIEEATLWMRTVTLEAAGTSPSARSTASEYSSVSKSTWKKS